MIKDELETREKLKLRNIATEWLRAEHSEGSIQSLVNLILSFTEPRDKQIEELEKENKVLRIHQTNAVLNGLEMKVLKDSHRDRANKTQEQLTKVNLLLKDVYKIAMDDWNDPKWHDQVLQKAREYLKEIKSE